MLWLVLLVVLLVALGAGLWFAGQKGWLPAWVPFFAKKKDGYMAYEEEDEEEDEDDEDDLEDDDDMLVIGGRAVSRR